MKLCRAPVLLLLCAALVHTACSSVGPFEDLSDVAGGIDSLYPRSVQLEGVPVIMQPTTSTT